MVIADILEDTVNDVYLYQYPKKADIYGLITKELAEVIRDGKSTKFVQDLYSAVRDANDRNEEEALDDMKCPQCGIDLDKEYHCVCCGRTWR